MKSIKNPLLIAISCLFISCGSSSTVQKQTRTLNIERYLDSIQNKFNGYNTNTVIKDELNETLKKDFKKAIKKGVLKDLPFKLNRVEKCGDKYILDLEHLLTSKYYDTGVLSKVEMSIYAITNEQTAKSIKEGEFYLIDFRFNEYITFNNNDRYCALVLMSPFMGYFGDEIQFGAIGGKLIKINKFTE
nr:hypothetical protein [uncultured Pedobacter sp.]